MKQHLITAAVAVAVLAVIFRMPSIRDAVIGEDPLKKAEK